MSWKYSKSKSQIATDIYTLIAQQYRDITYGEMAAVLDHMRKQLKKASRKKIDGEKIFLPGEDLHREESN